MSMKLWIVFLMSIIIVFGCTQAPAAPVEPEQAAQPTTDQLDAVNEKIDPCFEQYDTFYDDFYKFFSSGIDTPRQRQDSLALLPGLKTNAPLVKSCLSDISTSASSAAPSYEGDSQQWLTEVSSCYGLRGQAVDKMIVLLDPLERWVYYAAEVDNFAKYSTDSDNHLNEYNDYIIQEKDQDAQEALEKVKEDYRLMKGSLEKSKEYIRISADNDLQDAIDLYTQAVDKRIKALDSSGSVEERLFEEASAMETNATKMFNEAIDKSSQQFSDWRYDIIDKPDEAIDALVKQAGDACDRGSQLVGSVFPE